MEQLNIDQLKLELVYNQLALVDALQGETFNSQLVMDLMNQRSNIKDLMIETLQDELSQKGA